MYRRPLHKLKLDIVRKATGVVSWLNVSKLRRPDNISPEQRGGYTINMICNNIIYIMMRTIHSLPTSFWYLQLDGFTPVIKHGFRSKLTDAEQAIYGDSINAENGFFTPHPHMKKVQPHSAHKPAWIPLH